LKNKEQSQQLIKTLLENIGEDTSRAGLLDTPKRCVNMYEELLSKTNVDPKEEINTFFESDNDEPILVKDIQFYSLCEHHMLPFYGVCHIAYVPNNRKITGLSKLARLVESASRRLQIQEDMTLMLVNAIEEQLQPKGVYVIIEAEHMCMAMRGIKKIGSKTVTSKKTGIFLETDNKLTLKFKIDKKQPEKKLEQYTLKNIGVTSLDKLSYTLLYLMSNKVGKVERVKGNLTIQDNNYKFDLVGNNYEITGNNNSLGNNAVVIGTNLNRDIIEKLFENYKFTCNIVEYNHKNIWNNLYNHCRKKHYIYKHKHNS